MSEAEKARKWMKHCPPSVEFFENVYVTAPTQIYLNDDVSFGMGCYLHGPDIYVGKRSHFAPYCILYGPLWVGEGVCVGAHTVFASRGMDYTQPGWRFVDLPVLSKQITVDDNVWIGANCTIIQGVHIYSGSIVGAGSVVTHDVPENTVVGGVPARVIKQREPCLNRR